MGDDRSIGGMDGTGGRRPGMPGRVSALCPHCGFNLRREEETGDGPWRYSPAYGLSFDGRRLDCAPQVHQLFGSLILARGRTLTKAVLAERLGYGGDQPDRLISTLLSHGRRAVRRIGATFPVETVWSVGVRWNRNAAPSAAVRA